MQQRCRSLICVSTPPPNGDDPFARMLTVKFEGKLIFKSVVIRNMCDACVRDRLKTCPHMEKVTPPFNDPKAEGMIAELYTSAAHYQREILGAQGTSSIPAFNPAHVNAFVQRPRIRLPTETSRRVVLFGVDPGATVSNTAVVAITNAPAGERVVSLHRGCLAGMVGDVWGCLAQLFKMSK